MTDRTRQLYQALHQRLRPCPHTETEHLPETAVCWKCGAVLRQQYYRCPICGKLHLHPEPCPIRHVNEEADA